MRKTTKQLLLSLLLSTALFGCTTSQTPEVMPPSVEENSTGPSLSEYVNQGLEEAKDNGLYHETDYSDIRTENAHPFLDESGKTGHVLSMEGRMILMDELADAEYTGSPFIYVFDNEPDFTVEDKEHKEPLEYYSELDHLGRTGTAFAVLNESLMPEDDEERGDLSAVKPTGWKQAKYSSIDNGGWLYNRCHLIAWALAGENANEKNLMTGTRYFNVEGMLPFELKVLNYLDEHPENHVLYRATPVYKDEDLLAKGLLLEALSIEDDELSFCVFLFNVQPGVFIEYQNGQSEEQAS